MVALRRTLAADLERCKVDDIVELWVFHEDAIKSRLVRDVHVVVSGPFAGDDFYPVHAFFRGVVEVVDDDYIIAGFEKGNDGERANVARTSKALSAIIDSPVAWRMASCSHCACPYAVCA